MPPVNFAPGAGAAPPFTPGPAAGAGASPPPPSDGSLFGNLNYLGHAFYQRPDFILPALGRTAYDMVTTPLTGIWNGTRALSTLPDPNDVGARSDAGGSPYVRAGQEAANVALSTAMGGGITAHAVGDAGDLGAFAAYHGTPHEIPLDQGFKPEAIGTGEGAQAYGHGYYFAENPKVAGQYKDNLGRHQWLKTNAPEFDESGAPIRQNQVAAFFNSGVDEPTARRALQVLIDRGQTAADRSPAPNQIDQWINQGRDIFNKADREGGRLYQVHLDVEPHELLDFDKLDKPVSEQPAGVVAALDSIKLPFPEPLNKYSGWTDVSTQDVLHHILGDWYGNASPHAAQKLRDLGIPGIRYLDQGSRASGEGTRNIVMFPGTEGKIRITHVNGEPVGAMQGGNP